MGLFDRGGQEDGERWEAEAGQCGGCVIVVRAKKAKLGDAVTFEIEMRRTLN